MRATASSAAISWAGAAASATAGLAADFISLTYTSGSLGNYRAPSVDWHAPQSLGYTPMSVPSPQLPSNMEMAQSGGGATYSHQISAGYEFTGGAQVGLGLKNGLNFMANFGSVIFSQGEVGTNAENYNTGGYPIAQQEFSASYIGGIGYKRTFQFDEPIGFIDGTYLWEKHEISLGLFGFLNATWTFDGNWNLTESFKGIELKLEGAGGFGGSAWLKNGLKTKY